MQSACETGEVFALLEGGVGGAGGALVALYGAVREGWLTRGLLQYHARTGSARALDVLARAPDHHARLLLDALAEELGAGGAVRARALAALAPLCARRPPWLHRLAAHPALRAVLRAARAEPEPAPRLHALLALAALAHHAPPAPLPELAEAVLRAAAAPDPHLQLAAHALFHALYAAHPAALLDALRAECAAGGRAADAARGALPALLETTRLHPALVLGARRDDYAPPPPAPAPPLTPLPVSAPVAPSPAPPGSAGAVSRSAGALRPPAEPWFALGERCGADSAPQTPLPPDAAGGEGGSPPEAAVEATPENTPAKEPRAHFTFPAESSTVRALGRLSQPPSPLRKESSPGAGAGREDGGGGGGYAGRLARVVLDRAAAEGSPGPGARPSPVPFHGAPPAAAPRPEPRAAEPEEPEDREVLELTSRGGEEPWGAGGRPAPPRALLRALRPVPRSTPVRPAPAPCLHRAASCPPRAAAASRRDAAAQTVDTAPEPYEFIISDHFINVHDDAKQEEEWSVKPHARLDAYLQRLYAGGEGATTADVTSVLALTHAALQYERWRREAQAERCRRLLGRCRAARALELHNAALRDRARLLQRDLDECRARLAVSTVSAVPAVSAAPAPHDEHVARLEAELAAERAARARAEALLKESERVCLESVCEARALRGAAWEAARGGARLARAAAGGERRAALLRRLRRELLVLAERDRALLLSVSSGSAGGGGGGASGGGGGAEMEALRRETATLRTEARAAAGEAEAAAARAEAATARVAELEAALAGKEAAAAELRRAAAAASLQHAARLAALDDKYRALRQVQRRLEARRLELAAGTPSPVAGGAGGAGGTTGLTSPHSSPLSASLASAEGVLAARPALDACSRVRHLLEDDAPLPAPAPAPAPSLHTQTDHSRL